MVNGTKEMYILLVVDIPQEKYNLDNNIVLGVDLVRMLRPEGAKAFHPCHSAALGYKLLAFLAPMLYASVP